MRLVHIVLLATLLLLTAGKFIRHPERVVNGQLKCMVENCGSQIVWSIWNVTSGNGIKDPGDQVEPCGRNKVSRLNVSAYAASSDTMVIQCSESKSKRNGGRLYSKFFVQIPLQTAKDQPKLVSESSDNSNNYTELLH